MRPQQRCVRLANWDWQSNGPAKPPTGMSSVSTFHVERLHLLSISAAKPTINRNNHKFINTLLTHRCMPTDYKQVNMVVASYPFSKEEKCFYSKQSMPFFYRLTIDYFINTSFRHLMAPLSAKFYPGKTIVYLIQMIQTDFDIPGNVIATNTCIIYHCHI